MTALTKAIIGLSDRHLIDFLSSRDVRAYLGTVGATLATLERRARFGGRKGTRAARRLSRELATFRRPTPRTRKWLKRHVFVNMPPIAMQENLHPSEVRGAFQWSEQ